MSRVPVDRAGAPRERRGAGRRTPFQAAAGALRLRSHCSEGRVTNHSSASAHVFGAYQGSYLEVRFLQRRRRRTTVLLMCRKDGHMQLHAHTWKYPCTGLFVCVVLGFLGRWAGHAGRWVGQGAGVWESSGRHRDARTQTHSHSHTHSHAQILSFLAPGPDPRSPDSAGQPPLPHVSHLLSHPLSPQPS